jgi:hypothetical protein
MSSFARSRREKSLVSIVAIPQLSSRKWEITPPGCAQATKDAQTGDQPIYAPNQEEGEMKKNCYAYILPVEYYGNQHDFISFS